MANTDGPRMCGGIDESRARRAALSSTRTSLSEEPSFFTSLTFLDDGGGADVFDDELELHGNQEDMLWALTTEVKMVVNGQARCELEALADVGFKVYVKVHPSN